MIFARLVALAAAACAGLTLSGAGWAQTVSCPAFVLSDPVIAGYDPEDISCACNGTDLEVSTPDGLEVFPGAVSTCSGSAGGGADRSFLVRDAEDVLDLIFQESRLDHAAFEAAVDDMFSEEAPASPDQIGALQAQASAVRSELEILRADKRRLDAQLASIDGELARLAAAKPAYDRAAARLSAYDAWREQEEIGALFEEFEGERLEVSEDDTARAGEPGFDDGPSEAAFDARRAAQEAGVIGAERVELVAALRQAAAPLADLGVTTETLSLVDAEFERLETRDALVGQREALEAEIGAAELRLEQVEARLDAATSQLAGSASGFGPVNTFAALRAGQLSLDGRGAVRDVDVAGLSAGLSTRISERFTAGMAAGWTRRHAGAGGGSDSHTVSISPFAVLKMSRMIAADVRIMAAHTGVDIAGGDYDVETSGFGAGATARLRPAAGTDLFVRAGYDWTTHDVAAFDNQAGQTRPGFSEERGLASVSARVVHAVSPQLAVRGAARFGYDTIERGPGLDRESLKLSAGVERRLGDLSLRLSGGGEVLREDVQGWFVQVSLRSAF